MPGELKVLFPSDPARKIKDYGLFQAVCQELERRGNKVEEVHLVNIDRAKCPGSLLELRRYASDVFIRGLSNRHKRSHSG